MSFWLYICLLLIKNTKLALLFLKTKKELLKAISTSDSLFVFPYYHTGGAEKVHLKVAQAAIHSGLKPVFVFTGKSITDTYKKQFQKLGTVIDIGFRYDNAILNDHLLTSTITRINQSKLKMVFGSNSSFYYQILDKINGSNLKVIDLVHAYNPPFEVSNIHFKDVFHKINTRVFVNEPSLVKMQNFYQSNLPALDSSQFQLIYNSAFNQNTEPSLSSKKKLNGIFKIIFVARNSPEKRPRIAFEVAKRLTDKYSGKYQFYMVGDFDSYKTNYNSKDITIVSNLKDADEIIELYQTAHCLMLTSETEGFPLVISEAMFYNAVPVSTDVGGIPYILEDNKNAILINSLVDEESIINTFCKKIMDLSLDESYYRKLSSEAFETAKAYFSHSKFAENYKTVFSIS